MSRDGCGKEIQVWIPKGYHGYLAERKCGSTGIDGYPNLCTDCYKKFDRQQYREDVEACGERIDDDY